MNLQTTRKVAILLFITTLASTTEAFEQTDTIDANLFAEPPNACRQHPWLTYDLSRATPERFDREIQHWAERDTAGGFYLGMGGGNTSNLSEEYMQGSGRQPSDRGVGFLSDEYFALYAHAIEAGIANGIPPLVFYDEVGYPSGMAGGVLYSKYPQYGAKSLEMVEQNVTGPNSVSLAIPAGITLGAVMMNLETFKRIDISDQIVDQNELACDIPAGPWKVMGFYLDPKASLGQGRKSGYVDYLDPDAVQAFIEINFQAHYDHLKKYFGKVLQITHYDEPALHTAKGRTWTPSFNKHFETLYGRNPMIDYPALWYDIGPDTAAARNALWGFRAQLFSESYIKQMDDWCRAHNIMLSGHLDQEEIDNPVPVNGDLMLAFKHQEVPAIDDIWWWGRTNRAYKLISSAAYNWDKRFVMAETYAAYRDNMSPEIVYKVAMDQAAMGTNFQVGALPRDKTPESDRFIGRLSYMLQQGRHVADVAVLYPIASLQATYRFSRWEGRGADVAYAREGGYVPPEIDYIDLGEMLFRTLRQDFTFLHPEVLQKRCIIKDNKLVLNNEINRESYSVLIVPGGKVLSLKTARQIQAFYQAGGTVIATRVLAEKSVEAGHDRELQEIMAQVFGLPKHDPMQARLERRLDEFEIYFVNSNPQGGRAYFLPDYNPDMLQAIMQETVPVWDVAMNEPMWPIKSARHYDGSLTYIHKVKQNRHIYFFANSSDRDVDTAVTLRGHMDLMTWNPMDGCISELNETYSQSDHECLLTQVQLKLPGTHAVFFVEKEK